MLEVTDAELNQSRLYAIDHAGLFMDQSFAFSMRTLGIFLLHSRDNRHGAVTSLAAQPAEEPSHQHRRIQPICFGSPVLARYRHAGCMDHMGINATFPQPSRQPETIAPALVCDGDPRDVPSGLNRLIPRIAVAYESGRDSFWLAR